MQHFLVLKLPRTGSTMLCDVLGSHPDVECVGEALNPWEQKGRRALRSGLSDYYRASRRSHGTAVGVTVNPFRYGLQPLDINAALTPPWLPDKARLLCGRVARPSLKVIVLIRKNVLKQAISHQIALLNRRDNGHFLVGREHVAGDALMVPKLDLEQLRNAVVETERQNAALRAYGHSLRRETLDISYEDLNYRGEQTFRRIFALLGVAQPPVDFDYTAGFSKILSDDVRDLVANANEIESDPVLGHYMQHEMT